MQGGKRVLFFAKRFVCPQIHVFGLAKLLINFDIERVLKAYTLFKPTAIANITFKTGFN